MGKLHKKSLEGIKLEGQWPLYILVMSLLLPGISTMAAAFIQDKEEKRLPILLVGICQWVLTSIFVGWIWAIMWALEVQK